MHYIGLYVALQYLLLFVLIMIALNYIDSFMVVIVLAIFLLLVSTLTGMFIYRTVKKATMRTLEAEYIKKESEIKDKHFGELKEQYAEYKKLRHDFKNHLRILQEISDPEKMMEYANTLRSKIEEIGTTSFCDNLTLDALLSLKKTEAKQKEICINYAVCDIKDIKISDFDLCSVVANLLDNAIEAADKTKEKYVDFKINKKIGRLIITVINSSLPVNQSLHTTKTDIKNHGFGIKSVEDIAEKNEGDYVFKYEAGKFTSIVTMVC